MKSGHTPFVMPRFARAMWVSDHAREAWEGKIAAFAGAWRRIEWLTVVDEVRPCASFWLSRQELKSLAPLLESHGLRVLPLLSRTQKDKDKHTLLYRVVAGNSKNVRHFHKAWKRGDDDAIGGLLGYPACCRVFFRKVFVEDGSMDSIWPMAVQTSSSGPEDRFIEVGGPPELNPFWHQSGIRLTPHYPCRFDCAESAGLAKAFCNSGRKHGCGDNIDTALTIFQWPVEWSCLHGIAEIRTPILKMTRNTDATSFKHVIHRAGDTFPGEGARGLGFALKPVLSHGSL